MIRIGVTGHRPHRLIVPERKLGARVEAVLEGLLRASGRQPRRRGATLDVVSPLAEGCDRIVARAALALDQRLTVLLPFPQRDYETTFAEASASAVFRSLLRRAHACTNLGGSLKRANAGYVAVGMATLACSDVVLTIWDGKPAAGRGGTPEILAAAIEWAIPVIWIDAVRDRRPVLLEAPRRSRSTPSLRSAVRRARPLTERVLRDLAIQLAGSTGGGTGRA